MREGPGVWGATTLGSGCHLHEGEGLEDSGAGARACGGGGGQAPGRTPGFVNLGEESVSSRSLELWPPSRSLELSWGGRV